MIRSDEGLCRGDMGSCRALAPWRLGLRGQGSRTSTDRDGLLLDAPARFQEPARMPTRPEPSQPARAAWVREQPPCGELVLATGG